MRRGQTTVRRRMTLLIAIAALMASGSSGLLAATGGVDWLSYGPEAFRRAQAQDRPILLLMEVPWSARSLRAQSEVWSDPAVVQVVSSRYVAVRARADLRPDLARRYRPTTWPAVSVILPDGNPLYLVSAGDEGPRRWIGGVLEPEKMARLLASGAAYYAAERDLALATAQREEKKLRGRYEPREGEIGEDLAWSIANRMRITFDKKQRYFGVEPRLPQPDLFELLLTLSAAKEEPWTTLTTSSVETLLRRLVDPESGGIHRMARELDWSGVQREQLLDVNARMLETLALIYRRTGAAKWRSRAQRLGGFLVDRLGHDDGSFAAAACANCPGGRDATVLSGPNGLAAAALIEAGTATGDDALVERGLAAAEFLLQHRYRPRAPVPRSVVDGKAVGVTPWLADQAEVCWGLLRAYEVSGDRRFLEAAASVARVTLGTLQDQASGALLDRPVEASGPLPMRTRWRPLDTNARMARVLLRLYLYGGRKDQAFRRAADRILTAFGGSYREAPFQMPAFALAVYEYHAPPMTVFVTGPAGDAEADALRRSVLGSDHPFTILISLENERDIELLRQIGIPVTPDSAVTAFYDGLRSQRLSDPAGMRAGLYDLRLTRLEQEMAAEGRTKGPKRRELKPRGE